MPHSACRMPSSRAACRVPRLGSKTSQVFFRHTLRFTSYRQRADGDGGERASRRRARVHAGETAPRAVPHGPPAPGPEPPQIASVLNAPGEPDSEAATESTDTTDGGGTAMVHRTTTSPSLSYDVAHEPSGSIRIRAVLRPIRRPRDRERHHPGAGEAVLGNVEAARRNRREACGAPVRPRQVEHPPGRRSYGGHGADLHVPGADVCSRERRAAARLRAGRL